MLFCCKYRAKLYARNKKLQIFTLHPMRRPSNGLATSSVKSIYRPKVKFFTFFLRMSKIFTTFARFLCKSIYITKIENCINKLISMKKGLIVGMLMTAATLQAVPNVRIHWEMIQNDVEPGVCLTRWTFTNDGPEPLPATGWTMYYCQLSVNPQYKEGDPLHFERIGNGGMQNRAVLFVHYKPEQRVETINF